MPQHKAPLSQRAKTALVLALVGMILMAALFRVADDAVRMLQIVCSVIGIAAWAIGCVAVRSTTQRRKRKK